MDAHPVPHALPRRVLVLRLGRPGVLRFPSPYLRNEPILVDLQEMDGEELRLTRVITSYEEAFKLELLELYDCITQGRRPLTDGKGFRADLEVLIEIVRAL